MAHSSPQFDELRSSDVNGMPYDGRAVAAYFDQLAEGEWQRFDKHALGAVHEHIHNLYLERFIRAGSRVLEIGAGPGRFTQTLHRLGYAHSVEVWEAGELAGGLYGVAIGGLFAGESMFTRRRNASKVALAHVVERLRQRGFQLFDIQLLSAHTASLGAVEIPRKDYLERLRRALAQSPSFA